MQPIVDFILELDKLKAVTRATRPIGLDRYENSAEHSWQIAMLAVSLASYAEGPVDIDRVVHMLLVHDIGEIDTGDTIVYAEEGWEARKAAERAAVSRIFGMLPPGPGRASAGVVAGVRGRRHARGALRACGRSRDAGAPQPGERRPELA